MRQIAHGVVHGVMVVAYGAGNPTDEECREVGATLAWARPRKLLIYSAGGGLMPAQARSLGELTGERAVPVALLCASAEVRANVAALAWSGAPVRAFHPASLGAAVAYLRLGPRLDARIKAKLAELRDELRGEVSDEVRRALAGMRSPVWGEPRRLHVHVAHGRNASERAVSFRSGELVHQLLVDAGDVHRNLLDVVVFEAPRGRIVIDLPHLPNLGPRWVEVAKSSVRLERCMPEPGRGR
jgi:hypothetical protein